MNSSPPPQTIKTAFWTNVCIKPYSFWDLAAILDFGLSKIPPPPHFWEGQPFYLTFIDDKSIEKPSYRHSTVTELSEMI